MSTRPAQVQSRTQTGGAGGRRGIVLAPTLTILTGIFHILLGVTAIWRQRLFSVNISSAYPWTMSVRGWGILLVVLGGVAVLTGFGLFTGLAVVRAAALVALVAASIAVFLFLPYSSLWSVLIIALNLFTIWAVATERGGILGQAGGQMMAAGAGYGDQYREREFGREAGQYRETGQYRGDRWPAENVGAGRHWTPEPAKEGTGPGVARASANRANNSGQVGSETPEHAASAARARAAQSAQEESQPRRNMPGS